MLFSTTFLVMAVPLAVYAAPLRTTKRQVAAIDVTVLRMSSLLLRSIKLEPSTLEFANTLEQLESQFYAAGLSKFQDSDFAAAGFTASSIAIQQITNIQSDEATHASILEVCTLSDNQHGSCPIKLNFITGRTNSSWSKSEFDLQLQL